MDDINNSELDKDKIIGAACNIACDHLDIFINYIETNNSIIITDGIRESIYHDLLPKLIEKSREIIIRSEKL